MTLDEKEALLEYLDFSISAACESIEQHIESSQTGHLYDTMYKVLQDVEITLQIQVEFSETLKQISKHK